MPPSTAPIRVFIAGQSAVVRDGLRLRLSRMREIVVVGEASDAATAAASISRLEPDVAIIEENLPPAGAIDAVRNISQKLPKVRILVLASKANVALARQAVRYGALGFFEKGVTQREFELALRSVAAGAAWLHPAVSLQVLRQAAAPVPDSSLSGSALSGKELDVLTLLASGFTSPEIAQALGISNETVTASVGSMMQKFAVKDRTQAAFKAVQELLIDAGKPMHKRFRMPAEPPP